MSRLKVSQTCFILSNNRTDLVDCLMMGGEEKCQQPLRNTKGSFIKILET